MSSLSKAALFLVFLAVVIWVAGCNDAFRPIVIPIANPGPDPQRPSHAYILSNNGPGLGALSYVDVPGDTLAAIEYGGHGSININVAPGGATVYLVNQPDDTITQLTPSNLNLNPTTISLPAGAQPLSAYSLIGDRVYVAEQGRNMVAHINTTAQVLANEIAVGSNPVALIETPNAQKLYVVNQGDDSVSVVRTADDTVIGTIPVGSSPVTAVASSDGRLVFVANQGSSDVTVIDTTNDAAALTTIALGASPGCTLKVPQYPCFSLTYDRALKRVYTVNRANNTVSIIRADQPLPTLPSLITPAPGIDVTAAPCGGSTPEQIAVLPDGSRAYVVNSGSDNVCVLSSLSNTFSKSIALPAGAAPTSIAASSDGTKVYTTNPGTQNITIIGTTSDTVITSLGSPKTDPNCQDPAPPAPPICGHMAPQIVVTQ